MSLLMIVQFLMGLSILVAASRQAWAFSRDGALPFSKIFRPISHRFGYIPLRAVWGVAFSAAVLGLLSLIAPAAAQALFSLAVAGNNLAWLIPILARVVWGQKKFKPGPFYTGDMMSVPIAWAAVIFLVFGILLSMFPVGGPDPTRKSNLVNSPSGVQNLPLRPTPLWVSGIDSHVFSPLPTSASTALSLSQFHPKLTDSTASTMNYTVVINSAVWLGALGYYFIDAHKWFKGPKITIDVDDLTEEQQRAIAEDGLDVKGMEGVTRRISGTGSGNGSGSGSGGEVEKA